MWRERGRDAREGNLNAESKGLSVRTMPHFTVTKVEDPEEGAAGPLSPEPSSAEVKARIQDPQEPGKSCACSVGGPTD